MQEPDSSYVLGLRTVPKYYVAGHSQAVPPNLRLGEWSLTLLDQLGLCNLCASNNFSGENLME